MNEYEIRFRILKYRNYPLGKIVNKELDFWINQFKKNNNCILSEYEIQLHKVNFMIKFYRDLFSTLNFKEEYINAYEELCFFDFLKSYEDKQKLKEFATLKALIKPIIENAKQTSVQFFKHNPKYLKKTSINDYLLNYKLQDFHLHLKKENRLEKFNQTQYFIYDEVNDLYEKGKRNNKNLIQKSALLTVLNNYPSLLREIEQRELGMYNYERGFLTFRSKKNKK